ncbi:MAG: hypothetical protein HKL90_06630 [Elusimicrobia bacterium]|nr:hypothetical protein [Elusimicrobiota bacterium]
MPKSGGFGEPMVFAAVMGAAAGVVHAALYFAGLRPGAGAIAALAAVFVMPVASVVFGFVVSAVLFVIWKLMGSRESFETAYRCGAYSTAISPINIALGVVPFAGAAVGAIWGAVILIAASVETHKIRVATARLVFGILCGASILLALSARIAGRAMSRRASAMRAETARMQAEAAGIQGRIRRIQASAPLPPLSTTLPALMPPGRPPAPPDGSLEDQLKNIQVLKAQTQPPPPPQNGN